MKTKFEDIFVEGTNVGIVWWEDDDDQWCAESQISRASWAMFESRKEAVRQLTDVYEESRRRK